LERDPLWESFTKRVKVFFKTGKRESTSHFGTYTITIKAKAENPASKLRHSVQNKLAPILKETIRPMKLTARIPVTAAMLALLLITATGCNRLKARDQLTKGVQAFKNARYEEAVNHFQQSIALDPEYEDAKLYLATAYSYQVVPNLDTPENLAIAQKAIDGFNEVLAKNPNDLTALKQIASINRNIKKFDLAKEYEKKVIAIAPNDPEAYYTVAFVDWVLAYKNATTILAADGLTDVGDGNPKKSKGACEKLKAANTDLVNEGIQYLNKAIELNPNYSEAMDYLQLTYRRKADLECGDEPARKADMAQVDMWVQKSMGARKANELKKEKATQGGVTMQ
jgi:tetratricopeptide (TPR) repeat protein